MVCVGWFQLYRRKRDKYLSRRKRKNCWSDAVQGIPGIMSLNWHEKMGFTQKRRD